MEREFPGIGLTPLCAIGALHFYSKKRDGVSCSFLLGSERSPQISAQLQQLDIALSYALSHLADKRSVQRARDIARAAREQIFCGHTAESAVRKASEKLAYRLSPHIDPVLSAEGSAVLKARGALLSALGAQGEVTFAERIILVASEITEEELGELETARILGIVLPDADPFSSEAMAMRHLPIPILASCPISSEEDLEGRIAVIDSEKGVLIVSPAGETVSYYAKSLASLALGRKPPLPISSAIAEIGCISDALALPEAIGGADLLCSPFLPSDSGNLTRLCRRIAKKCPLRVIMPRWERERQLRRAAIEPLLCEGGYDITLMDSIHQSLGDIAIARDLAEMRACLDGERRPIHLDSHEIISSISRLKSKKASPKEAFIKELEIFSAAMVAAGVPFTLSVSPLFGIAEIKKLRNSGAAALSFPSAVWRNWRGGLSSSEER